MSYQGYPGEVIDVDYTEVAPASAPPRMNFGLLPRSTSAKMGKIVKDAMLMSTHDQCLARITMSGMNHTAALAMSEAQFAQMTPQAAAEFRAQVSSYGQSVVEKIRGWR